VLSNACQPESVCVYILYVPTVCNIRVCWLQVCRVAQAALRSDRKEQKLQETTERWRAGDKLAVPDPIYLIGRRSAPVDWNY
jgi:hypothetical protein